eukprot:g54881.t1
MPKDTPLHKAAYKGETDKCEELINSGVSVNVKGAQNRTPLHRAVGKGHDPCVQLLIDRKADLSLTDGGGLTALHWAALFGLCDTGAILVKGGAEVNAQAVSGETPLHLAAEKGKVAFVKFLLDNNADPQIRDASAGGGQTAWDVARKGDNKEVKQLLKPPGGACCVVQSWVYNIRKMCTRSSTEESQNVTAVITPVVVTMTISVINRE